MVFKSVGKAAAAAAPSIGPRSLSGDDRYAQIIIPPIERNLKRHSRQQRQKKSEGVAGGGRNPIFSEFLIYLCFAACSGLISFWRRRSDRPARVML